MLRRTPAISVLCSCGLHRNFSCLMGTSKHFQLTGIFTVIIPFFYTPFTPFLFPFIFHRPNQIMKGKGGASVPLRKERAPLHLAEGPCGSPRCCARAGTDPHGAVPMPAQIPTARCPCRHRAAPQVQGCPAPSHPSLGRWAPPRTYPLAQTAPSPRVYPASASAPDPPSFLLASPAKCFLEKGTFSPARTRHGTRGWHVASPWGHVLPESSCGEAHHQLREGASLVFFRGEMKVLLAEGLPVATIPVPLLCGRQMVATRASGQHRSAPAPYAPLSCWHSLSD